MTENSPPKQKVNLVSVGKLHDAFINVHSAAVNNAAFTIRQLLRSANEIVKVVKESGAKEHLKRVVLLELQQVCVFEFDRSFGSPFRKTRLYKACLFVARLINVDSHDISAAPTHACENRT